MAQKPAGRRRRTQRRVKRPVTVPLTVELLETRLTPSFTVGANINITKSPGPDIETSIAVNPTNPKNLFATETATGLCFFSLDGGATWKNSQMPTGGPNGFTGGTAGDQQEAWDEFGNLFVAYFAIDSQSNLETSLALSTDGGATFTLLVTTGQLNDQPEVAVGHGEVWWDFSLGGARAVQGTTVTGLGQVTPFTTAPQTLPGFTYSFGGIAIGPNGQVLVVGEDNSGPSPAGMFAHFNPTGVGGQFGSEINLGTTNIGAITPITPQPNRTIDAEMNLAWDRSGGPHNGRLYMVYTDRVNTTTSNTDIYVTFSDDNGANWSPRVRVNDDPANSSSHFLPAIALDQTTGDVGVAWYDCRNDTTNHKVEVWGTISEDGGATWDANQKLSVGQSVTPSGGFDFGDYNQATFDHGVFYYSWADNSNSTGDNPAGSGDVPDIYTVPVTVSTGGGGGGGGGGNLGSFFFTPDPATAGQATTLTGKFTDMPGMFTTHQVDINWGDGTPDSVFNLSPVIQTFSSTHVYVKNGDYIADTKITPLGGPGTPLESQSEVIVSSAPPSVTIGNLPAKPIPEAVPYTLAAGASEPGNPGQTFSYAWSISKNGRPFVSGSGPSFTFTPDDEGTYQATVKATDSFGVSATDTSPVITVADVPPTGQLLNDGPKPVGDTVTFFWNNQHDAPAETAAGFTYSYDFNGDGTFDLVTNSPTATFTYTSPGIYTARGRIANSEGSFTDVLTKVSVGIGGNGGIVTTRYLVTGADAGGGPNVKVYNPDGSPHSSFFALNPMFTGGVRVATGDVNGDGIEDIITAAGPGGGPQVQAWDGRTGALLSSFFAYDLGFTGGVYVASGDVNGDGFADVITGVGGGGGPHVKVFDGKTGNLLQSFFAYNPGVTTGVTVAAGDVDGDGKADIITGAGPGGGPHVQVFRGTDLAVLRSFFATAVSFTGGVYVAAGDLNGDGVSDLVVGLGASATATDQTRVRVFNGASQTLMFDFAPYGFFHGGARVGALDLDGDGRADIAVAPASGHTSDVLALSGRNLSQILNFSAYDPSFLGGVFVG